MDEGTDMRIVGAGNAIEAGAGTPARRLALAAAALLLLPLTTPAVAQNRYFPIPAANSTELPPGIAVRKTAEGDVYVDAKGRTLYGMDFRTLYLESLNPAKFCSGACAEVWEAVAPPANTPPTPEPELGRFAAAFGSETRNISPEAKRILANQVGAAQAGLGFQGGPEKPGPDWTVTEGANGPQLMYKRTNLVFVRKGDKPGSLKWDGEDKMRWNALRYVPPAPKVVTPPNVGILFVAGGYALADKDDRVLFTQGRPKCRQGCEAPKPFTAGLISKGVGDWTIARDGDVAQWLYRGKPVFVNDGKPKSADIPAGAAILRP